MSRTIDLRSDTVTRPTEAMRRAMAEAEVGDDWYGDDPTVNRLQERAAEVMGTEAALYLVTGTMANEIALHVLVRPGHLVVTEAHSHVAGTEAGSAAVLAGVSYLALHAEGCRLTAEMVAEALEPDPYDVARIDLVTVENTHNAGMGAVMPLDELQRIRKTASNAGLPEFVAEARRAKILFGAAWRQAGVLAAAGLVALEEGPKRLPEDHASARRLAEAVAEAAPGSIDPARVETNILYVDPGPFGLSAWDLEARLRAEGVLSTVLAGRVRQVTHRDVTAGDVDRTIEVWRGIAREGGVPS